MDFFEAKDGTRIFFRDQGEGAPVILIHGWPLNADMFEYQTLDLLRKGFRVIAYDRRGFGRSEQPATGYDYNTFADDLNALIEHLQFTKVSLVGFSMGGGEIARYMARYGAEKVASVALIGSVAGYLLKDQSNPDGVEEKVFAQMITQLEEDRPHFLTGFTKQFFGENIVKHTVSKETEQWCFNLAMMAGLKATIECVTAFSRTDFRQDLSAITVPALIIHGTSDKTVPPAPTSDVVAKMIPQANYIPYDGAPHGLFITHKQQLNRDLYGFLDANRGEITDRVTSTSRASRSVDSFGVTTTRQ